MKILTEAVGALTSPSTIRLIHEAGYCSVGIDCDSDCPAKVFADEFYTSPRATDPNIAEFLFDIAVSKKIDLVIPTLDDTLLIWAAMKEKLAAYNVRLALSDIETIKIFEDKWDTYVFFSNNNILTPKTSLKQIYPLVKPRNGRGGAGVKITDEKIDMTGMISQEVIKGTEYTIDVFCDKDGEPVYIVPRIRKKVLNGKSSAGEVVHKEDIISIVKKICKTIKFKGIINLQCFETTDGKIIMTEINPRKGGGTVLGMAATENWIPLIVDTFVKDIKVRPSVDVKYGLKMGRFYDEVYYM